MMRRLLVNDCLTTIPGTHTFWHDLRSWFDMHFVAADYKDLAAVADEAARKDEARLIVRNASWFGPIPASLQIPTISLLQDIFLEGEHRTLQDEVIQSSTSVVLNSRFTGKQYGLDATLIRNLVIPLPVDFSIFEPGNPMGLQQALSLPDRCVCWIGACKEAATIKGYDIFLSVVRWNPDIPFVGVFKDSIPEYSPPNLRCYSRLPHSELVRVIGACRAGLCTSRQESQHLAGVEMGACGLPIVAPPTGTYFEREDMPGVLVTDPTTEAYGEAIRVAISGKADPVQTRAYWKKEFDKPVIRALWKRLIEEVECSGQS